MKNNRNVLVLAFFATSLLIFNNQICAQQDSFDADLPEESYKLVEILSEPEDNLIHSIRIFVNEDNIITHLERESSESIQVITTQELLDGEVVLAESNGIDAVFLGCNNCNAESGGEVYIKYLYNGALKTYRIFPMNLKKVNNHWTLMYKNNQIIYSLRLISRVIFGKLIGIKGVSINDIDEEI